MMRRERLQMTYRSRSAGKNFLLSGERRGYERLNGRRRRLGRFIVILFARAQGRTSHDQK